MTNSSSFNSVEDSSCSPTATTGYTLSFDGKNAELSISSNTAGLVGSRVVSHTLMYPASPTSPALIASPRRHNIKASSIEPSILSLESLCNCLIRNYWFQQLSFLFIVINATLLGIGTLDMVTENPQVEKTFEVIDIAFLAVFTLELLVHFVALGAMGLLRDGWLLFDLVIISSNWFARLVLSTIKLNSIPMLRALRILRLFRLVGKVHVMRCVAIAFLSLLPRMGAIMGLLLLFMYIFAVIFTSMFKTLYEEGYTSKDYFSRIDLSLFTLMQIMTTDGWADIAREVMVVYPWSWFLFVSFVTVSVFILVNLVAVVVFDHDSDQQSYGTTLSTVWDKVTNGEGIGNAKPVKTPAFVPQIPDIDSCDSGKMLCEMQSQINTLEQQMLTMNCLLKKYEKSFEKLNEKLDSLDRVNVPGTTDVAQATKTISKLKPGTNDDTTPS